MLGSPVRVRLAAPFSLLRHVWRISCDSWVPDLKPRPSFLSTIKLLFGFGFAGLFGFMAFRNMEWGEAWAAVKSANPFWIFVAVLFLGIDYSLRVVRWWLMVRAVTPELPLRNCFGPFLASIALNNVLPFRAGDISRAFGFKDRLMTPPVKILSTMLVERLLDLVTLLSFLYAGLAIAGPGVVSQEFIRTAGVLMVIGLSILGFCLVFPKLILRFFERYREKSAPGSIPGKIADLGIDLFGTLVAMRRGALLLNIVALSAIAWFFEGVLFVGAILAISPESHPVSGWFSLALGTLATLIPSTPGYVGTFDFFAKLGYESFGVPEITAGTAALLAHVLIWVPLTAVGGGWMLKQALTKRSKPASGGMDTPV